MYTRGRGSKELGVGTSGHRTRLIKRPSRVQCMDEAKSSNHLPTTHSTFGSSLYQDELAHLIVR